MKTANTAVEAIWMFRRGTHAVNVWRFVDQDGRRRILIDGPAALNAVADFANLAECRQRQRALEGRLSTRGFHLRQFGVERRSWADRRAIARGVDRRAPRTGNSGQVSRYGPQPSLERYTHVKRRPAWYVGVRRMMPHLREWISAILITAGAAMLAMGLSGYRPRPVLAEGVFTNESRVEIAVGTGMLVLGLIAREPKP